MAVLALMLATAFSSRPALSQRGGPPPGGAVQRNGQQQPIPPLLGYKDPELATVLGLIVPGGGQIYSGRSTKGALLLSVSIAAPVMGILGAMAMDNHCCRSGPLDSRSIMGNGFGGPAYGNRGNDGNGWAPIAAGFGVSAISWAYGWATAASDARQHNQDRGFPRISALVQPLGSGRTGLGLSLSVP